MVVIVLDTTRFDHLGFYGYGKDTTPFLDSLAEQAVVFDHAYSASSWTAPATASVFTSVYPDQHGVTSGYFFHKRVSGKQPELRLNRIPTKLQTLPEMLQVAGYETFGVADNMNVCERMGFTRGFDHFEVWPYEGGAQVNSKIEDWLPLMEASDKPFFLYAQYMDPHQPYQRHEDYFVRKGTVAKEKEAAAARYDSELRYTDQLLRETFEALGLNKNSLVILTADHGEEFGDHGGEGHGGGLYEELVHVPLMVISRDSEGRPDFVPGRVRHTVSTVDILPTLRELLDQPVAEFTDGRSLAGLLRSPDPSLAKLPAKAVFGHRSAEELGEKFEYVSVNDRTWQLIMHVESGEVELFDLAKDPQGSRNLAGSRPAVLERLMEKLDGFRQRPQHFEREYADALILDEAAQAELGRLGYAE